MAIYRTIQLSFWTDEKVVDEFTPEDKYFYLYLFTNPQTNLCGCYELGWVNTTSQLGYNRDAVLRLLDRFENVHKVIKYSKETKEVLLLNWHKYNWQGGNQIQCIAKEINKIKSDELRNYVTELFYENLDSEGAYKGLAYPLQATVTVTDTNTVTDSVSISISNIVNYLNNKLGTNYKSNTKNTVKHIKARLNEGYTEQDFFDVIDKKYDEWYGTEMQQFLVPDTLFGTKFEKYLNQQMAKKPSGSEIDEWEMLMRNGSKC